MITPAGFLNPSSYLETVETANIVKLYTDFFTGVSTQNPGFKVSVRCTVKSAFRGLLQFKDISHYNSILYRVNAYP